MANNNKNNNQLTKLRIYPSFTEVRNSIKATSAYKIYFNRNFYNQIIPGSINLEDVEVLSINSVEKSNNLEGKVVFIKKDNGELRQVKVIRSRDLLVQDLQTKRYFNVLRDDFEFNDQPEESGVDVTFAVHTPGDGVLSYLMNGIKWETRYTLDVEYDDYEYKGWGRIENDKYEFQGWADIINNTENEYNVEHTELFGGDIHIQKKRPQVRHMAMRSYAMEMDTMCLKSAAAAPTIKAVGETSGLYMYASDDEYKLDANDRFSLPFLSPLITFDKVASCETYFNTTGGKGKFSRIYKLSSNEFLPHGTVTVREDGRIVGQSNIPDLSADESHELDLGTDPDVSYERDVKQMFIRKDEAKYEVKIKILNNKQRDVLVRYSENLFHSGKYKITETQPRSAVVIGTNSISYENHLKAKETATIKYVIHLDYKSENK